MVWGDRRGSNPRLRLHRPEMLPLHHGHHIVLTNSLVEHRGIEPLLPHCKCRVNTQRMPQSCYAAPPRRHNVEDRRLGLSSLRSQQVAYSFLMATVTRIELASFRRQRNRLTRCVHGHGMVLCSQSVTPRLSAAFPWWRIGGSNP